MLTLGIVLLFLVGFAAVSALSPQLSHPERWGLSFPIGTALVTFGMLLCDAIGLPLTGSANLLIAFVLLVGFGSLCFLQRKALVPSLCSKPRFTEFNLIWVVLLLFIAWLEYANLQKCLFFPTYDRDSMAAFDTIGFLIGKEHTLHGLSIFTGDYMPGIHGPGSPIAYTPMLELAYGYVYSLGAETSKLIPGLVYLSFLFAFYGITARFTSHTMAMLATLFVLLTPEMTSFSSLSGTNTIHAVFASLGMAYVVAWFKKAKNEDLWLGSLLLAANVWVRAEGIVFLATAGLLILWRSLKTHKFTCLIPIVLSAIPIVVWTLFTKFFGMTSVSVLVPHLLFDGEKAATVWAGAKELIGGTSYYGWTFVAALLALLADSWYLLKRKDSLATLFVLLLPIVLYFFVLYQIDYRWDSMDNVLRYSAKRFVFSFVPIAWYFVATSEVVKRAACQLDKWLAH